MAMRNIVVPQPIIAEVSLVFNLFIFVSIAKTIVISFPLFVSINCFLIESVSCESFCFRFGAKEQ